MRREKLLCIMLSCREESEQFATYTKFVTKASFASAPRGYRIGIRTEATIVALAMWLRCMHSCMSVGGPRVRGE